MLSPPQIQRYARHLLLSEVGSAGQERLLAATIAVPGTGRAAEEAARYLCAAGVGRLLLHPTLALALGAELAGLNPDCAVATIGDADLRLDLLEPADDRLAGALGALSALVEVATEHAGPDFATFPDAEIAWTRHAVEAPKRGGPC